MVKTAARNVHKCCTHLWHWKAANYFSSGGPGGPPQALTLVLGNLVIFRCFKWCCTYSEPGTLQTATLRNFVLRFRVFGR